MGNPAGQLRKRVEGREAGEMGPPVSKLCELTLLNVEPGKVDTSSIYTGRCPRLESGDREAGSLELFGKVRGCSFTRAAARDRSRRANVDASTQEGSSRDYDSG